MHVSWDDAVAYARWASKRLPTEAEWEFACRGGLEGKAYAWGDETPGKSKYQANTWQGHFPEINSDEDGFPRLSPVKSFPPNSYGVHDMIGNVWEWCSDWYRPDTYRLDASSSRVVNPTGPGEAQTRMSPISPNGSRAVGRSCAAPITAPIIALTAAGRPPIQGCLTWASAAC